MNLNQLTMQALEKCKFSIQFFLNCISFVYFHVQRKQKKKKLYNFLTFFLAGVMNTAQ